MSERSPRNETGIAPYEPPVRRLPLFVYGTLTDVDFVSNLLERRVTLRAATLQDYRLVELESFGYPLVVPHVGGRVAGQIVERLGPLDYERLDAYEGVGEELYLRVEATIQQPGGDPQEAYLYAASAKTLGRYV